MSPGTKLARIAARDMWRCHLCGGPVEPKAKGPGRPSLDHLLPSSQGGTRAEENLKLAHAGCNSARGDAPVGSTQRCEVRAKTDQLHAEYVAAWVPIPVAERPGYQVQRVCGRWVAFARSPVNSGVCSPPS